MYDTCLWMPAHSHVNLYAACLQVNLYVAQPWVGLYDCLYAACPEVKLYVAPLQVNLNATYPQVNLHLLVNQTTHLWANMYKWVDQCASCEWEKQYAHWVNNKQNILLACFNVCNLLHFEESHVSVWRDSTIQYSVADHPFFVFHPKLVDCSDFGETFKMYAQYLQQYQLVHIIEFVLQWCNHWCHFISKHACMLVNLDLTPQQHCQRAHWTMCQSQYRKHDFAIMSSVSDFQANYTVVGFVKYLENIIQWAFQPKNIYKTSVRYGAMGKIQTNKFFEFSEQNESRKIGGGKYVEKIEMDVISPFITNTPPNISDIEMCEFVDHLETSECLKKYQGSDHLLCNIPLCHFVNYLFQPNRIPLGISIVYILGKECPSVKLQTCLNIMMMYASMNI